MRVFICGIIQGSIAGLAVHEQSYRRRIREVVERHIPRAQVYCPVSLHPESLRYEEARAFEVFDQSVCAARESDLLVAYVPEASMGSAIEMWEAKKAGAKVVAITPMVHNWVVRYASDVIVRSVEEFEKALEDPQLRRRLGIA